MIKNEQTKHTNNTTDTMEQNLGTVTTVGSVRVIHHSTANVYCIIITTKEAQEDGSFEDTKQAIWIDYYEFNDLKEAINLPQ